MVFSSLQSDPSAELEAQTSSLGEGGILLSSLALGQEKQRLVAVGKVRLHLGVLLVIDKNGLGQGPERRATSGPALPEQQGLRGVGTHQCAQGQLLSLSGPGGASESEGRNEVRKALGWAGSVEALLPAPLSRGGRCSGGISGSRGIFLRGPVECGSAPVKTRLGRGSPPPNSHPAPTPPHPTSPRQL